MDPWKPWGKDQRAQKQDFRAIPRLRLHSTSKSIYKLIELSHFLLRYTKCVQFHKTMNFRFNMSDDGRVYR